jgi:hypothetical protein
MRGVRQIEALAAKLRAGGLAIPEGGPIADTIRLEVVQRLARLRDCAAP